MLIPYAERFKDGLFFLFLALLIWLPIPLGSKLPWSISVMEIWIYALTALTTLLVCISPSAIPQAFKHSYLAMILLFAAVIWMGMQCIPLPASWLEILSPHAWMLYGQAGQASAHHAISLDINTSFLLFQKSLAFFLLFCLTLMLVDTEKKLRRTAYALLFSGLLQALIGTFAVMSMNKTMFLNEYTYAVADMMVASTDRVRGTFTNPDHLAGYLEMTLAIGIGLMISMLSDNSFSHWKHRLRHYTQTILGPKARVRGALIIICIALVMTGSRMGNSAFFFSLAIAGIIFLRMTRHTPRLVMMFLSSMIILDILIIGSWFGFNKVVHRIESTSLHTEIRDEFIRDSLPILYDYTWTGIGSGNYYSTLPGYKQPDLYYFIAHVHNDYLELLIELGMIGTAPLVLLLLLAYATIMRNFKARHSKLLLGMSFASLMGMTSILIHSSVDFNLQIPSNAALFTVLLAMPFLCMHIRMR